MKLSKSLFLAFAGLGLFACSNEDVVENGSIEGGATVTVKVVGDALSRALETPTTGNNGDTYPIEVKTGAIKLTAGQVANPEIQISDIKNGQTFEFTGVRNPQSIEVVINNGVSKETGLKLVDVVETGLAEPLYGTSTEFQQGADGNYTVTINLERRLARLQFSGIDFNTEGTSYTALTLDGIYLNGAKITEKGAETKTQDADPAWSAVNSAWGTDAPVFDVINAVIVGEGAVEGPWPVDEQCYAYNIFPVSSNLPKLTVCFSNAVQTGVTSTTTNRYARVANYKIDLAEEETVEELGLKGIDGEGNITEFVAGYIYNITGLMMDDEDLGPTPEGGKDAKLTATVKVEPWTLVNATVDWQ